MFPCEVQSQWSKCQKKKEIRQQKRQSKSRGEFDLSEAAVSSGMKWDLKSLPRNWTKVACASLVAQLVKNLPAMQETQIWSLGQEDPLEKEMATHSSILAWRIPWTQETCGLQSMGLRRVGHNWVTNTYLAWMKTQNLSHQTGKRLEVIFSWIFAPGEKCIYHRGRNCKLLEI